MVIKSSIPYALHLVRIWYSFHQAAGLCSLPVNLSMLSTMEEVTLKVIKKSMHCSLEILILRTQPPYCEEAQ